jgi:inosose dehydratase
MTIRLNRRTLAKTLTAGAASMPALLAAASPKLKIGYTCIIWNTFARSPEAIATLENAVKDISDLGFWGYETFLAVIEDWDSKGKIAGLHEKYKVPLVSAYHTCNLIDPAKRKDTIADLTRMGKTLKKNGGRFLVVAPNSVKRDGYDFKANKDNIVSALNEYASAITDIGLGTGLHQHTGTCIESRDEVYAIMDAVNTKKMKFAPDVGQLQKGGADAAKVVKDYLPIVAHMHLKDFDGGPAYGGYCPLGMGKVDLKTILEMLEKEGRNPSVMVELDPSKEQPMTALETAKVTKAYLQKLNYTFKTK